MTGPFKLTMQGPGGQALRAFIPASAAVGTYLPVDKIAVPKANSPDSVTYNKDWVVTDIVFTTDAGASGAVELIVGGDTTGLIIEAATNYPSNTGRQKFAIPIISGQQYRLRVVEGFPA